MRVMKFLGTLALVFAVSAMTSCKGSDQPTDVLQEIPAATDDSVQDEGVADEGVADEGAADEGVADEGAADEGLADDTPVDDGSDVTDSGEDADAEVSCEPKCEDRVCGPDPVCKESCGTCEAGHSCDSNGQCQQDGCEKVCGDRVCGPDPVCGQSCGGCDAPYECNDAGQCECEPNCEGLDCGPDPKCGQSCGGCDAPYECNDAGQCECEPNCHGRECGNDPKCGLSCGGCDAPYECNDAGQCECRPNCEGLECGNDPKCGLSCGTCTTPAFCNPQGLCECTQECGLRRCGPDPICGQSCGTCSSGFSCDLNGLCSPDECAKQCGTRICGPDPVCGASCGACDFGYRCDADGQCQPDGCLKQCDGRVCGPDPVCGQACGNCVGSLVCDLKGKCIPNTAKCDGDWCFIQSGAFQMGSPNDELGRFRNEGPVHTVTITRPFYIKQYEVTQGEWKSMFHNNPSRFSTCGDECPVDQVNWFEAVAYANALSEKEGLEKCYTMSDCSGILGSGNPDYDRYQCTVTYPNLLDCKGYRLPTEAEWEYAARAGVHGPRYGEIYSTTWFTGNSSWLTHPVGEKSPNNWGLYDVLGNVKEWVNDLYDEYYYSSCNTGCQDPLGPDNSDLRVQRGGCWANSTASVRLAVRDGLYPRFRNDYSGFRLARTVP